MRTNWGNLARLALRQVAAESYLSQQGILSAGEALLVHLVQGANPRGSGPGNTLRLTAAQAARLVQETDVVAQHENDLTGFSATLMRDRQSGQWQIALRGTEFLKIAQGGDWERDGIFGADGQLASHGLALAQLDQMRRVFTGWSQRFALAGEQIDVTGYSLGGHLATGFTELFPESVRQAVNFNGPTRGIWSMPNTTLTQILDHYRSLLVEPGASGVMTPDGDTRHPYAHLGNVYRQEWQLLAAEQTDETFGLRNLITRNWFDTDLPAQVLERLTLVYGHAQHDDIEIISARGVHANGIRVFIEGQPSFTDTGGLIGSFGGAGQTHSLTLLIDALLVHDAIARLAPGLQDNAVEYLIAAASLRRAKSHWGPTHHVQVEGDSFERAIDSWRRLFLGDAIEPLPWSSGITGYGDLHDRSRLHAAMEELLALRATAPPLEVFSLDVRPSSSLEPDDLLAAAQASIAHRYALWSLSPFVVSGDDSLFALPGRAERLSALTPTYLASRAEFAYHFWQVASSTARSNPSDLAWRYLDLGAGHDLHSTEDAPRLIFGSIGRDVLQGGDRNDRLFGDDGSDLLYGGSGADWLEGGLGDDWLDGGPNADRLDGGAGFDLYRADAGDVLVDTDGSGRVEFGGQWLGPGFTSLEPDLWTGWDNTVEYRLEAGGLRVRRQASSWSSLLGPNHAEILIRGWQPGDLGIQLLDIPIPSRIFGNARGHQAVTLEDAGRRVTTGAIPGDPAALQRLMLERPFHRQDHHFSQPVDRLHFDAGSQAVTLYAHPGPALWVRTGAGQDFVVWQGGEASGMLLHVDLGSGHDRFSGTSGMDLVLGGDGGDQLTGVRGDDILSGEGGADLLDGGPGVDRLSGGDGNDWILGGAGSDVLTGDAGADRLYGDAVTASAFAFIGGELLPLTDIFYWYHGTPPFPDGFPFLQEVTAAASGNDWLSGGAGEDRLHGGGGDDHLEGGEGADLLFGEGGNDWLQGGAGDDILVGDSEPEWRLIEETPIEGIRTVGFNNRTVRFYSRALSGDDDPPGGDRLEGGRGNDELRGGLGDDTYVYRFREGIDRIDDSGGRDRLLLEGSPNDWRLMPDFLVSNREDLLVTRKTQFGPVLLEFLSVRNWFGADVSGRIEVLEFDDGTHWREADLVNAVREQTWFELAITLIFGPAGGFARLLELMTGDAPHRARGGHDLDVIDARGVTLLNEAGERLGVGRTTLEHLRREGMDLVIEVAARLQGDGPILLPQGQPAAGGGSGPAPVPPAAPEPLVRSFRIHLEGWFDPANRVEFIALDDIIIGLPDAPPVAGSVVLAPYVEPGGWLEWQVPAGAFLDGSRDLLSHGLRGGNGAALPAWIDFDPATATLRAAPGLADRGLLRLELLASDLAGSSASRTFDLNIGMPLAPYFTALPQPTNVIVSGPGTRLPWPWRTEDPNAGDTPTVQLLDDRGRPSGFASAAPDGVRVRPGPFDTGVHTLTVRVTDRDGLVVEAPWQVTVHAPVADPGSDAGADPGRGVMRSGTAGSDLIIGTSGDDLLEGGPGDDWLDGAGGDDRFLIGSRDGIDTLVLHAGARQRIDYAPGVRLSWAELSMLDEGHTAPLLRLRFADDFGLDLPGLFTRETRLIDGEQHVLTRIGADSLPALELRDATGDASLLAELLLGGESSDSSFQPAWFARPETEAARLQAASIHSNWQHPRGPGLRFLGGDGAERLVGSGARDRLYGGAGADRLEGLAGDDLLYGEDGADHIEGGTGDDWLSGGTGNDFLAGGAGHDHHVRSADGGHDVILDREGDNSLWLIGGLDVTGFTRRGHDVQLDLSDGGSVTLPGGMDGRSLRTVLWADTPGSAATRERSLFDLLRDHGWSDAVPRARADIFHLRMTEGAPLVRIALSRLFDAGDGDPLHYGLDLLEAATGGTGWLRLDASSGQLSGRPLADDGGAWAWRVMAQDPLGQTAKARLEALVLDENIRFGSAGNDLLQVLPGGSSALYGLAGNDRLIGGPQSDVLVGGAGTDRLFAGDGDDRLHWSADRPAGPFDRVLPPEGTNPASIALDGYWLSDDILQGGADEDVLIATEGNDALRGHAPAGNLLLDGIEIFVLGGGNDLLALSAWRTDIEALGGGGDDILWTGSGNDRLSGGAGDDWLSAGAGDDELAFGSGNDRLQGGLGNDRYFAQGQGLMRIEDSGGQDLLFWSSVHPDAPLTVERVGEDLHLRIHSDLRVEIAAWFRPGGAGRIEHLATPTRLLEAATLDAWLAGAGGAAPGQADAPGSLPEDLWIPHRWGVDPLPPASLST